MKNNSWGITRGFILPNGDIAKTGTRHEDIALEYLSSQKAFWDLFQKKGGDLCDFMVLELGALKVGCNSQNPMVITYKYRRDMPKEFWDYIDYYQSKGYRIDEI